MRAADIAPQALISYRGFVVGRVGEASVAGGTAPGGIAIVLPADIAPQAPGDRQ